MPQYTLPDLVYRALTKKRWLKGTEVTFEAYLRRIVNGVLENGPSVGTSKQAAIENLKDIRFVGKLKVSEVETIRNPLGNAPLKVVLDKPTHGEIIGVPDHRQPEYATAAEQVAGELARITVAEPNSPSSETQPPSAQSLSAETEKE